MALDAAIASAGTLPLELDGTAIDPDLEKKADDHVEVFVRPVGPKPSPGEFSSTSESSSASGVGLGFGETGGPGTPFITNQRFDYPFPDVYHSPTEDRLLSLAARPTLPSSVSTESSTSSSSSSSSSQSSTGTAGAASSTASHSPVQPTHCLPPPTLPLPLPLSSKSAPASLPNPNPLLAIPIQHPPTAVAFSLSSPPSARAPHAHPQPQHPLLRTQTPPVPPALRRRLQRSRLHRSGGAAEEDGRSESAGSDEVVVEGEGEEEGRPAHDARNIHINADAHLAQSQGGRGVTTAAQDCALAVLFVGVLLALHASAKLVSSAYALLLSFSFPS